MIIHDKGNSCARGSRDALISSPPASLGLADRDHAVRHALMDSSLFVPQVSLARMSSFLSGSARTERVAVGSGCVHTHGVSAGVPVDTIGFYSAAAFMARATALNKLVILIAPAIAAANECIDLKDAETAKQLDLIEEWHTHIASQIKGLCAAADISVEIVKDRDLTSTHEYRAAQREREKRCSTLSTKICPYSAWQDLIFRTLHTSLGAGIKVGWTPHNDAAIQHAYPSIFSETQDNNTALANRLAISHDNLVQGACEVAFDTNTRAMWPDDPIQACYIPAAVNLEGKTVAPYTAKPIRNSSNHGRILLAKDSIDSLHAKLLQAIHKHPIVALSFIRQCKTIDCVFPSLGIGISAEDEATVGILLDEREKTHYWIQKPTKEDQCQKLSAGARTERHARKKAEFSDYASEIIAPRLEKLILKFGI